MSFRLVAAVAALAALSIAAVGAAGHQVKGPEMTVYKSATCGCCSKWIEHMKSAGFQVRAVDLEDLTEAKQAAGVPLKLQTCHTALVEGYAVEGHVPADLVKKLLAEKPKVAGIAVPGMPSGSPGMESADRDPYDVLLFDKAGTTTLYAKR
jgi:hypothetical protein